MLVVGLIASASFAAEPAAKPADLAATRLYDLGKAMPQDYEYRSEPIPPRKDWQPLAENDLSHKFKGDVVLESGRLYAILSRPPLGAGVFTEMSDGKLRREAAVGPLAGKDFVVERQEIAIVENTEAAVAVRAAWIAGDGKRKEMLYRVTTGQAILEARPGPGVARMTMVPFACELLIPDYFGEDMGFSFGGVPSHLPAESMLLGTYERGPMPRIMLLWSPAQGPVRGPRVDFAASWQIACVKDKPVWVAALHFPGWSYPYHPNMTKEDWAEANRKLPFAAKWRGEDFRGDGTSVSFTFEGSEIPPGKPCYYRYPLDRTRATPLDVMTPMDIMRNTLGVGPCQYVLDAEGLAGGEAATPAFVMEWVEKQLKRKKVDGDEVRDRLKAMTEHVGRTHARIKKYADFAEEVGGLVARGWRAVPPSAEEAAALEKLRATVADMKASAATGLAATEPEKVTKPADEIAGLVGKEDALAKAAGPVAEVRAVGAAEDRALAKCRMATRWLRCQCLDIVEGDAARKAPALAELAKRIEARAGEMLAGK